MEAQAVGMIQRRETCVCLSLVLFIYVRKMAGSWPGCIYRASRVVKFRVVFTFRSSKPKLGKCWARGATSAGRAGVEV